VAGDLDFQHDGASGHGQTRGAGLALITGFQQQLGGSQMPLNCQRPGCFEEEWDEPHISAIRWVSGVVGHRRGASHRLANAPAETTSLPTTTNRSPQPRHNIIIDTVAARFPAT
jgi:hypothetical protein